MKNSRLLRLLVNICLIPMLLALPFIAACGKSTSNPTPTSITSTSNPTPTSITPSASSQVHEPEGSVTVAVPTLGEENWLLNDKQVFTQTLMLPALGTLTAWSQDGKGLVPSLATDWNMSADGMTWTFNLRKGVQFHDNWGEFTAEDVKFSYELATVEASRATIAPWFKQTVSSVEVVNPYQVVFHLTKQNWELPGRLADLTPFFPITCKKYVQTVGQAEAGKHFIGTGPFKMVEYASGDYIKFEALDNGWQPVPYVKNIIIKKVPEASTRLAMLKTGEINLTSINYDDILSVEAAGLQVISAKDAMGLSVCLPGYFPLQKTYDPTVPWASPDLEKSAKVRKALSLAINRKEIIKYMLMGRGSLIPGTSYCYPGLPTSNPAWTPDPYDPTQALKLLAEAGYKPSDLHINFNTVPNTSRPQSEKVAEAVAMYWMKLGIDVKIANTDFLTMLEILAKKADPHIAIVYSLCMQLGEPIGLMTICLPTNSKCSYMGQWPTIDKLIVQANAELNYDKRQQIVRQIGDYLYNNTIDIPVCYADFVYGASAGLDWPQKSPIVSSGYFHNFEFMRLTK